MNLTLYIKVILLSTFLVLTACGGSASDSGDTISHVDSDHDGIDDDSDMDDDDDGVNDSDDAFPLNNGETLDTDADGVGNNADSDDDGDGVADTDDACPLDATETLDSDGDGVCDMADATPNGNGQQMISGGVVGGFGSIYVNGVKYSTDTAEFVNDKQQPLVDGEQQLEVGDYVWVQGTLDADGTTGVATRVIYDVDLKGTVSAIDPASRTFTVLGRSVSINPDTVFDDDFDVAELSGLSLGAIVEISGFDQSDGSLLATRIDLETSTLQTPFKVEGLITAVDVGSQSLNIAAQAVDFSSALINFSPTVNQWVEVYGALNAENIFVATKVEPEDHQGD
jgi:hypothetical protein